MTTLVLNYSRSLFEVIGDFLSSMTTAIQVSRQIEANQRIAVLLRHEYPHENYDGIVAILNDKTLKEYYK